MDVAEFDRLLAACAAHPHEAIETCSACAQRLEQAVELYRDDFLQHFQIDNSLAFEEWTLFKREGLHRRVLEALDQLTTYQARRGAHVEARRYVQHQLDLEPWREEAHRQVMQALAASGQRSAALAQYGVCRKILLEELGVEPEAETTALYERIKRAETQPPEAGAAAARPATFSDFMPNKIGVGDVLQYNSGGLRVAVIHGRTSPTVFTVKDKNGGTPTAAPALTAVSVYRAYTSLANWQSQTQNGNITADTINPNKDLVTFNTIMNVACYGDGVDTTAVAISGWTTGANNYIKIYTPVSSSEVGVSQRHNGVWDDSKYRIQAANARVINIGATGTGTAGNVWIDGLQIYLSSATSAGSAGIGIDQTDAANHRISNNIIRGVTGTAANYGIFGRDAVGANFVRIWNNII